MKIFTDILSSLLFWRRAKTQKKAEPGLLFYSCADAAYEDFAPLYIASILWSLPEVFVEVGLVSSNAFMQAHGDAIRVLNTYFKDRFLLRDVPWHLNGKRILPNTVRFINEPLTRAAHVYIGDIDIIHLDNQFPAAHLDFMRTMNLPYANSLRSGTARMTGLHFTTWDAMYPLPDMSDVDLSRVNDELVLGMICDRRGLPRHDKMWRPVPGIHISPNRKPVVAPDADGKRRPTWGGLDYWADIYKQFRVSDVFKALYPALKGMAKEYVDAIDDLMRADAEEEAARRAGGGKMPSPTAPLVDQASDLQQVFTNIFHTGKSRPSRASLLHATKPLRAELTDLFRDLDIKTLVDAPCGTGEWITTVTGDLDAYYGFDIVSETVAIARELNKDRQKHVFDTLDVTTALVPRVDAILCRDCLVHLTLDLAQQAIENFKASGSTYLLATTFPTRTANPVGSVGGWRPLNLQLAPFNFPEPVRLMRDRLPTEGDNYADKSVGVWRISDLV